MVGVAGDLIDVSLGALKSARMLGQAVAAEDDDNRRWPMVVLVMKPRDQDAEPRVMASRATSHHGPVVQHQHSLNHGLCLAVTAGERLLVIAVRFGKPFG